MTKLKFACSNCGRTLTAAREYAGRRFRCPGCGQYGIIPQPSPTTEPTPEQPKRLLDPSKIEASEPVSFRSPRRDEEGMDLTSMVDVVFLLLIFFMVTASYSMQKSLEMPRPDQQEEAAEAQTLEEMQEDDYIIVRVSRDNTIWVNDVEAPSEQELLYKLREAKAGMPGAGPGPNSMLVLADREAKHELVVMVLDAGNAVGMENVRLACVDEDEL